MNEPVPRWEIPVVVFPKMANEDNKPNWTGEKNFEEGYYRRFKDGYEADSDERFARIVSMGSRSL